MSLFNREEEYDDEEEERSKKNLKVRDLNPVNKRKRKEPPKPWGKKERLVVLFFFLFTCFATGFLYLGSVDWKLGSIPRIRLPEIKFFEKETVIIGDQSYNIRREKEDKIISSFIDSTDKLSGKYVFYVWSLGYDAGFGYKEKDKMEAASLIKLPVMAYFYNQVEAKKINPTNLYILKKEDIRGGSGSLQYKNPGYKLTYADLLTLMGKESDNTAFNVIVGILGKEKIQEYIGQMGLISTSLEENTTSAYDISLIFKKLTEGKLINSENTEKLLASITDTIYEEYIPKKLTDVKIAHKFGKEVNVINDAGIVYAEKPYIVVFLSKEIIEKEADVFIPDFSLNLFNMLKDY